MVDRIERGIRVAHCPRAGVIELRQQGWPTPGPGEAVVQVHGCGVCGSDLHFYHGGFPPPAACPGHEIAGVVVSAGAGAEAQIGSRVAVEPLVICGTCSYCQTGNYQLCPRFCIVGNAVDGGFADAVRVPVRCLFPLPDTVDLDVATLTEPLAVAVHALRLARIEPGDRVAVLGAGTIGLMSVAAARSAGAGDVWVSARYDRQQQAAEQLGASRVFRGSDADDAMRAAARSQPVDLVIETVGGTAPTLATAVRLARPGGTVVVLGVFTVPAPIDAGTLVVHEVRLIGSMTYGRSGTRADFERAIALLAAQPETFRSLITHRLALDDIDLAFRTAGDKRSGAIKVQVRPRADHPDI